MKKCSWLTVGIMVFALAGCNQTPAQRVAAVSAVASEANSASMQLNAQVAALKLQVAQMTAKLSDPNVDASIRAIVAGESDKIQKALTTAIAKKAEVDNILAASQDILAKAAANPNIDIAGELQTYGLVVQQGSAVLPPPYNTYLWLAGMVVAAAGSIFGTRQVLVPQVQALQDHLTNVIKSVDVLLPELPDPAGAKAILKSNQPIETQAAVDQIKSDVKFAA